MTTVFGLNLYGFTKVLAYDEETGRQEYKKVVQLFRNSTDAWGCTTFDCDETPIKSTGEHPYFVLNADSDRRVVEFGGKDSKNANGQWIAVKDLRIGDICLLASGKTATIKKLEVEHLAEPETTYNFEVADSHTYYVGEQGILVHNACPPKEITYDPKQVGKKWGEHKLDYPDMQSHTEYIQLADDVFHHSDTIIEIVTRTGSEFHYMQGNNLLRVKPNGEFISLYPLIPK